MGNDDFQQQLKQGTDKQMILMNDQIDKNKEKVIERMLELVYDISPEIHENFRPAK